MYFELKLLIWHYHRYRNDKKWPLMYFWWSRWLATMKDGVGKHRTPTFECLTPDAWKSPQCQIINSIPYLKHLDIIPNWQTGTTPGRIRANSGLNILEAHWTANVGIILSHRVTSSLLCWPPVLDRIISACLQGMYAKLDAMICAQISKARQAFSHMIRPNGSTSQTNDSGMQFLVLHKDLWSIKLHGKPQWDVQWDYVWVFNRCPSAILDMQGF